MKIAAQSPAIVRATSTVLAVLWVILGLALVVDGIIDTIKWQSDPVFASVGLTWNWSGLGAGALALAFGTLWLQGKHPVRSMGYVVATLFGLYTVVYLVFGGEGAVIYRFTIPLAVLALSITTGWHLVRSHRNRAQ